MLKFRFLILFLIISINYSCSKELEKEIIIEKSMETEMIEAYQQGLDELDKGDSLYAAKKFNEAETLFPQSIWAPRAALMAAYSYYLQDYYGDATAELERFFKIYPNHKNTDYAHYLLAITYYEQIIDEKKDLQAILSAKKKFLFMISQYPNTEYTVDAKFKLKKVNEILASKELYVGRYYFDKKKWIPAINRFKVVVDDYQTTIYIEEALYRLVEIYYLLGLKDEAKKYAQLLGYNYQSSDWYKRSYKFFDDLYEIEEKNKEKSLLKKVTSLFK
jgi:outer membrane protein assembly factor BamD